jgi:hypothetical protein
MSNLEIALLTFIGTVIFVCASFRDSYFIEKKRLAGKVITFPDNTIWVKHEVNNDR